MGSIAGVRACVRVFVNHCVLFFSCSSLTEKIVAVLPRMKCPHRIEPHQIQGMDFIHIFPVVQVSITHSFPVKV